MRRRDHVRALLADADDPRHDQARRVMESYEREWLAGQPVLLAILHCVGLFDRPASGDCLKALRAKPAIPGLTDELVNLDDEQWRRSVARLREVRLSRRPTRPIPKRSTPIRWCANGSANGSRRRMKPRGKTRTAASMSICATRRAKAKRQRWPISRRSTTPFGTAAKLDESRRRFSKFISAAFVAEGRTVNLSSIRTRNWAQSEAIRGDRRVFRAAV